MIYTDHFMEVQPTQFKYFIILKIMYSDMLLRGKNSHPSTRDPTTR